MFKSFESVSKLYFLLRVLPEEDIQDVCSTSKEEQQEYTALLRPLQPRNPFPVYACAGTDLSVLNITR